MIFISYSRADYIDEKGNVIAGSAINTIVQTLKEHDADVWIDITDHNSVDIPEEIATKIRSADAVVFLSSANSNSSVWVEREINYAFQHGKTILPVKLDMTEYNSKYDLLLSNVEYVEYYKNVSSGLEKILYLLKIDLKEDVVEKNTKDIHGDRFVAGLRIFSLCFLVFICSAVAFFSVGFGVGYYSQRITPEELLASSFQSGKIYVKSNEIICFNNEVLPFDYNVTIDKIEFHQDIKKNIFNEISFEKVLMSISMAASFERLLQSAHRVNGNSRNRIVYVVVGSVGILCGYSIGEYVGKELAQFRNVYELKEHVEGNETTKRKLINQIKIIYNED